MSKIKSSATETKMGESDHRSEISYSCESQIDQLPIIGMLVISSILFSIFMVGLVKLG